MTKLDEIRDYITAIKVVVTDARNKKTENIIPVTVTPVFENISSTDNLVDEIAKRFSDEKYMSKCFKKIKGLTPKQYRNEMKAKKEFYI